MPQLELYERRNQSDKELPVHMSIGPFTTAEQITAPHWHEHIELVYIAEGTANIYIDQQCYFAQVGDLAIANSGQVHSIYRTQNPYRQYVMIIDLSAVSKELYEKNYIFSSLIQGDETIQNLLNRIFLERVQEKTGWKQLCRALITELLVYLSREYVVDVLPSREMVRRRKALERLKPALIYIDNHLSEHLTMGKLAKTLYISEERFGHLFREGIGQPPLQYINTIRLQKAVFLLKTGEYTVTEVATAVGFCDYNHFGRLFRKRYGYTPNQVRLGKVTVECFEGVGTENSGNV